MANCTECGKRFPIIAVIKQGPNGDVCSDCFKKINGLGDDGKPLPLDDIAQSIILTTESVVNSNSVTRICIISSTVDSSLDIELSTKQNQLFNDLKRQASELGANAVIGVKLEFVETFAVQGGVSEFKKFKVICYGTAVVLGD